MKCLLWISVISVLAGAIFGSTGNDNVDKGLEVAEKLAETLLGNENFSKSLNKVLASVAPFLGMVGPAIGLITGLIGMNSDSAELAFMKKMQAKIDNRFDQVDTKLDSLSRKVDWSRSQIQFFDFETNILSMKMELDKIFSTNGAAELESLKTGFTRMYECVYQKSAQMLYNHIIPGSHQFSSNILEEVIKAYDYDRKTIQAFMLGLTKLVLTGSQVEMAYYQMKYPALLDRHKATWEKQFKNMKIAMDKADKKVADAYRERSLTDAKTIMTDNMGKKNKDVAKLIYEKLTQKYSWRDWFVIVYKDLSGGDKHWVRTCSGESLFRYKGFNLVLQSASKTRSRKWVLSGWKKTLETVNIGKKRWTGYRYRKAKDVFNDASRKIGSCSTAIGLGVIRKGDVALECANNQAYKINRRQFTLYVFR